MAPLKQLTTPGREIVCLRKERFKFSYGRNSRKVIKKVKLLY